MHMKKPMLKNMLKTMPILLACAMYFGLAGCGTKGPLYIPEQRYPEGVPKDVDKGVNNDATKKDAPEANIDAPSRPAP
jgi:predicted small lipoprotein YifL